MSANPIDLIGGLATTGNVVKADISSWAKARVAQVLADATEVRNTVLALQLVIFVKALSATYRMDTTDTTTADDGVSCIISSDGFRFKAISSVPAPTLVSLGGVFANPAVAHQFLTGLDTSGNLLRAQPSLADLSDGITVKDTDGTFAANSDTRIASQKATKTYVDTVAQGLSPKASVLCATTANITLSGEQTIDGVATSASRVLVKNQTTSANNGIYISAAGAWTRSLDTNAWSELTGAFVFVDAGGTVNGATGWVCIAAQGGTIGTTTVPFTQFSGAGTYTAGTGLTLTGTSFAIDSTVATLTGAQALTNKTVNGLTLTASSGTLTLNTNTLGIPGSGVVLNLAGTGTTTQTFPTTSATLARTDAGQTFTGTNSFLGQVATSNIITVGFSSPNALYVSNTAGANAAFTVDTSVASMAAGIKITGAVTGGLVAIAAIDSGANTNVAFDAKGTGAINIAQNSSGNVQVFRPLVLGGGGFVGSATFANATSGIITVQPPTGALGSQTLTLPVATDTLVGKATTDILTNKSLTAPVITGAADIQGAVTFSGNITPTQITADQNDYAPTGFSATSVVRISTDASRNITGLAGGANGRDIYILNVGSFPAVLKDEGAGSTAANRFGFGADLTLASKQGCALLYDSTASRWRQVGGPSASGGGTGTVTSIATTYPLSGGTITTSGTATYVGPTASGLLSYVSATAIKFVPRKGDLLKVNGVVLQIPAAGIAGVANTSVFVNGTGASNLANSTFYYVYAFSNSGTVTADFRTGAHSSSSTAGNIGTEILTGDDTRSLIGMIQTNSSGQFVNSTTQQFVRSWFNDPGVIGSVGITNASGLTSTTAGGVEVTSTLRVSLLTWSGETVTQAIGGRIRNGTTLTSVSIYPDFNGAASETVGSITFDQAVGGDDTVAATSRSRNDLTEGLNYATVFYVVSSGTAIANISNEFRARGVR